MKELDKEKIWRNITADESYPHFAQSKASKGLRIWAGSVFVLLLIGAAILVVLQSNDETTPQTESASTAKESSRSTSNDDGYLAEQKRTGGTILGRDQQTATHSKEQTTSVKNEAISYIERQTGTNPSLVYKSPTTIDDRLSTTINSSEHAVSKIKSTSDQVAISSDLVTSKTPVVPSSYEDLDLAAKSSIGTKEARAEVVKKPAAINDQSNANSDSTSADIVQSIGNKTNNVVLPTSRDSSLKSDGLVLIVEDNEKSMLTDGDITTNQTERAKKDESDTQTRTNAETIEMISLPTSLYSIPVETAIVALPSANYVPFMIEPLSTRSPHSLWLGGGVGLYSVNTTDTLERDISTFLGGQKRRLWQLQLGYRYDHDKYFAQVGLGFNVLSSITQISTRRIDYETNSSDNRLEKLEYLTTYKLPNYLQQYNIDLSVGRRFEWRNLQWSLFGGVQYQVDHVADGRIIDQSSSIAQLIDVSSYDRTNRWSYLAGIQVDRPIGQHGNLFCKAEATAPHHYNDLLGRNQRITTGRLTVGYRFQF